MDKVTQSNAGNAEETAAAAEELTAQATSMRETVTRLEILIHGQKKSSAPVSSLAAHAPAARNKAPALHPEPVRRHRAPAASRNSEIELVSR